MTKLDKAIRRLEQGRFEEGQQILEELRREEPDNPVTVRKSEDTGQEGWLKDRL